jgi:SAM-dependent methyltransferase
MRDAEAFWEERYQAGRTWSGKANGLLVDQVAGLAPGVALDLGCGEGGDVIWLAQQGWQVTGVDVSRRGLALAAEAAEEAGVGGSVAWEHHDLTTSFPTGRFDLVASSYLHAPADVPLSRSEILRSAAGLVRPGGSFVVVGHAGPPSCAGPDDHHHGVHMPTPDEVLDGLHLPPGAWDVVRSATVEQPMTAPDGSPATRPDNVLHVRRR